MKCKILSAVLAASIGVGTGVANAFESIAPKLGEVVNNATQMNVRVIAHAKHGQMSAMKEALYKHGATFHTEGKDWIAVTVGVNADNYQELLNLSPVLHVEKDQMRYVHPVDMQMATAEQLLSGESSPLYREENGELIPYGIDLVQAAQVAPVAEHMPKVCIVDTGYDIRHPDLQKDDIDGTDEGAGLWSIDGHGHGTHVAGTIAALGGNGIGVVGVIPHSASLYITRVFDNGGQFVYASDLAGAIQDCANAGAKVVSMSLGGLINTEAEEETLEDIAEDGVLLIAAAGNSGNALHSYPASYESVMSVAAIDHNKKQARFSQRTAQVEIAAPGVRVLSTYRGEYAYMSGTSMATPHVSAVAALVWSHYPECSAEDIRSALTASSLDIGAKGYDYRTGYGMVQANAAMQYLADEDC